METSEQNNSSTPVAAPVAPKKKGGAAGILCVIFALIALGACGFIVYDKVISKKNGTNCVNIIDNGEEEQGGEPEKTARRGFEYFIGNLELYVTKAGDVYFEAEDFTTHQGMIEIKKLEFSDTNTPGKSGSYTISNKEIEGYIYGIGEDRKTSYTFNGYKVDTTDVIAVYNVMHGQNWNGWDLMLIKGDGKVDLLTVTPGFNGEKAMAKLTKNFGGYENIIGAMSVIGDEAGEVMLLTKDGGHVLVDYEKWEKTYAE